MEKQEFINRIGIYVVSLYPRYRILPSLAIGQGALESGWGKHMPGNNAYGLKWNPFAKTGWQLLTTKEWDKDRKEYITIKTKFRKYNSLEESLDDYLNLLQRPRYKKVLLARDYKEAANRVAEAGYATSPVYANTLIKIIEKNQLYTYDAEALALLAVEASKPDDDSPAPIQNTEDDEVTYPNKTHITPHFKWSEFRSPDGAVMSQEVKDNLFELCQFLERLREAFGNRPIHITKGGGHRSPQYNAKIRTEAMRRWPHAHWKWPSLRSQHLLGKAADIKIPPHTPIAIAHRIRNLHFRGGIGVYHTFTHVDTAHKRSWGLISIP